MQLWSRFDNAGDCSIQKDDIGRFHYYQTSKSPGDGHNTDLQPIRAKLGLGRLFCLGLEDKNQLLESVSETNMKVWRILHELNDGKQTALH